MKIVLVCPNSKYVHTSLAIWYIKAYIGDNADIVAIDTNIHRNTKDIADEILSHKPDVVGFSTYIFNVNKILELIPLVRAEGCKIVLGGPEAEYNTSLHALADTVMSGTGESCWLKYIKGERGRLIFGDAVTPISPYTEEYFKNVDGKIAYFEGGRGCPFCCSYCMSAEQKSVFFDLDYIKKNLLKFKGRNIRVIKFVDRTFNANKRFAQNILQFIIDNFSNDKLTFHFEVAPDLFDKDLLETVKSAREGLFQFEAGIQSLNSNALDAVNRKTNMTAAIENLNQLVSFKNCKIHTDMIVGLPKEDYLSAIKSFDGIFKIGADMFQVGFLKILKGSALERNLPDGYVVNAEAPYEILASPDMTPHEIIRFKNAEIAIEKLYNSGKFARTIKYALTSREPFFFFESVGKLLIECQPLSEVYSAVFAYLEDDFIAGELLRFDYIVTNNSGKLPPTCKRLFDASFKSKTKIIASKYPELKLYSLKINPDTMERGNYVVGVDYSKWEFSNAHFKYFIFNY